MAFAVTGLTVKDVGKIAIQYCRDVEKATQGAMLRVGERYKTKTADMINTGGRSGALYFRGGQVRARSAYGEPAKTDTGNLASSLRVEQRAAKTEVNVGYLNSVAPYGAYLEDATGLNRLAMGRVLKQEWNWTERHLLSTIKDVGFRGLGGMLNG